MNDLETRKYEMLTRVVAFRKPHPDLFPPKSMAEELMETVTSTVGELEAHATSQITGSGGVQKHATAKQTGRLTLRGKLDAIRTTALAIALNVPGFERDFKLPRRAGDAALLAAANAFAKNAEAVKERFLTYDMPPDFIETLSGEIQNFKNAGSDRANSHEVQVTATAAIDTTLEKGVTAVRHLNAILRNKLGDDVAVRAWSSASHVERPARSKPPATVIPPAPSVPSVPPAQPQ